MRADGGEQSGVSTWGWGDARVRPLVAQRQGPSKSGAHKRKTDPLAMVPLNSGTNRCKSRVRTHDLTNVA